MCLSVCLSTERVCERVTVKVPAPCIYGAAGESRQKTLQPFIIKVQLLQSALYQPFYLFEATNKKMNNSLCKE